MQSGGGLMKQYYEAYDERYKTAHEKGVSWSSENSTPIVLETVKKYISDLHTPILEIGCGEGRDAKAILEEGYHLLATDISKEAIAYCKANLPAYAGHFEVLDCIRHSHPFQYGFIYSVAVIHMLVLDEDRTAFYRFIYDHLAERGIALICTMGDGENEMKSDINTAFQLQERDHESGKMMVAGTSCRMVSFTTFENELRSNKLRLIEKGITASLPDFNSLMYAVVQK